MNPQPACGVTYYVKDDVAIVTIDNPPVNGLSHSVRQGIKAAFDGARLDDRVGAIVLTGAGKGFSAGGDIREFGTPAAIAVPALSLHVHPVIEESEKPVVAAIHGLAIGGGLETALVCHYRIAAGDTRIGLPELKLGVIPLSGTQRLPRVLGLDKAVDVILSGETRRAREYHDTRLFDQIVEGNADSVLAAAIAFAREKIGHRPLPRIRDLPLPDSDPQSVIERARSRIEPDDIMAQEALNAIAAAAQENSFEAGMSVARAIYNRLIASDHVRKRRDDFFAARTNKERTP
jgi:enoyl-CoA hydratase